MANENRLIDANALIKKFDGYGWGGECDGDIVLDAAADAPTVDAEEVVHGRWKDKQTNSIFTWHLECSVCGADYHTPVGYNYCPNCGAKMDGGNEDGR